ncbi:hypothetical protein HC766_04630 [Candidatus Gracilibacteria bacterium]|nr:hypothetical protein [Thermales bacterium]NJL97094.1 hypothetical protein [Candidatus Gracilibacteria bacterium]NJS41602.1 hypothetical protein [Candidatus Gracilibacteria bacterium]
MPVQSKSTSITQQTRLKVLFQDKELGFKLNFIKVDLAHKREIILVPTRDYQIELVLSGWINPRIDCTLGIYSNNVDFTNALLQPTEVKNYFYLKNLAFTNNESLMIFVKSWDLDNPHHFYTKVFAKIILSDESLILF